jgi:ribulose-phosphate 3-epimerase
LKPIQIVPSILSADIGRLAEQVREAEAAGADRVQVDVMDGHFVPNLTFGPATVAAVRGATNLPIEAHLMVERPELFVERFAEAGADYVIVHAEATYTLFRTLTLIEKAGARPGVALSPATPFEAAREVLADVVMALVMTVEPGFGGQSFIASMTGKVRSLREAAPELDIEVDGGIDARTVPAVVEAGANLLVAGSSVYGHPDGVVAGIKALRDAAG